MCMGQPYGFKPSTTRDTSIIPPIFRDQAHIDHLSRERRHTSTYDDNSALLYELRQERTLNTEHLLNLPPTQNTADVTLKRITISM